MANNKIKYFVDIGMLISFILVFATGIIKFRKLLSFIGINLNYEGLPMKEIAAIHDWSGVAIGVFVLIHLILNLTWIIETTKDFFEKNKK